MKLHFNSYIKIRNTSLWLTERFNINRKKYNIKHLKGEERYQKLYITGQLPIEERRQEDHVYEFYRNKEALIGICYVLERYVEWIIKIILIGINFKWKSGGIMMKKDGNISATKNKSNFKLFLSFQGLITKNNIKLMVFWALYFI